MFWLPESNFSYVLHSGFTSDLDFVVSNNIELQRVIVDESVSNDVLASNHLHLKFFINFHIPQISQKPQRFWNMHWDNIDTPLYRSVFVFYDV